MKKMELRMNLKAGLRIERKTEIEQITMIKKT